MAAPAHQSIRRLTADEALRMVAAGIVGEDEPVELLDGVLVGMSPQGPVHSEATANLATAPEGGAYCTVQVLSESDLVSPPELADRWSVRDLLP